MQNAYCFQGGIISQQDCLDFICQESSRRMRFSIWIWQVRHDHSSDPLLLERASDLEGKLTKRRI